MLKGQILYYLKNTNCARLGALAVYEGDDGRYITVRWLRNHLSCTQMNGGYHLDDFRLATQAEIEAHLTGLAAAVEEATSAVAAAPRFTIGDYVYAADNPGHIRFPYKVLDVYNGIAFCYRITLRGKEEHTTHKVENLELRPGVFATSPVTRY